MAIPPRPADLPPGPTSLPRTLGLGLAGVLLEAAILLLTAVWFLIGILRIGSTDVAVALFLVLFAAGVAVVLAAAARALRRGGRGGRAPVLGWQVLQAATAAAVLQVRGAGSGALWVAAVALAAAVVVVVMLLTPSAVRFTTGG